MIRTIIMSILVISAAIGGSRSENCKNFASGARSIMHSRQVGTSVIDVMRIIKKNHLEFMEPLVIMAYEQPRFDTKKYQVETEIEFENMVYVGCIKNSK